MVDKVIPADVRLAAKRGFVRTSTQALATTIPTVGITGAALSGADPVAIAWSVGAAVLSSLGAGVMSWLQITSSGIPDDYQAIPPGTGKRRAVQDE